MNGSNYYKAKSLAPPTPLFNQKNTKIIEELINKKRKEIENYINIHIIVESVKSPTHIIYLLLNIENYRTNKPLLFSFVFASV